MNASDVLISRRDGTFTVKVTGRANFDYAVPLRDMVCNLDREFKGIEFDLSDCITMDSTFMGVMSMLGLKAAAQNLPVRLSGVSPQVRKLLTGLGIDKLFTFVDSAPATGHDWAALSRNRKHNALKTAETVVEAHRTLVDADNANREKFDAVIELAQADLDRLQNDAKNKNSEN